jgi:hypothetical protein
MNSAAEFLLAIKETTGNEHDPEAVEFLEKIERYIRFRLDQEHVTGERRDRTLFYEGMLKGAMIGLRKGEILRVQEMFDQGLDPKTGRFRKDVS